MHLNDGSLLCILCILIKNTIRGVDRVFRKTRSHIVKWAWTLSGITKSCINGPLSVVTKKKDWLFALSCVTSSRPIIGEAKQSQGSASVMRIRIENQNNGRCILVATQPFRFVLIQVFQTFEFWRHHEDEGVGRCC